MGIDMTPNPHNPNYYDGKYHWQTANVIERSKDHIIYEADGGDIFYTYDTENDKFLLLNLPKFMANAPTHVKSDTVEWVRATIRYGGNVIVKPDSLTDYLNDPKTKAMRNQIKRGYATLEDFQ